MLSDLSMTILVLPEFQNPSIAAAAAATATVSDFDSFEHWILEERCLQNLLPISCFTLFIALSSSVQHSLDLVSSLLPRLPFRELTSASSAL